MKNSNHVLIQILVLSQIFITLGCESNGENNPIVSSSLYPPTASGMWITNENGPTPIGSWGNPTSSFAPYPNPFNQSQRIPFYVGEDSSTVRVWIVRALSPYEEENRTSLMGGSGVLRIGGNPVFHYDYSNVDAGYIKIAWTPEGLPSGFYRIYIEINGVLDFTDVFLSVYPWDVPNYLEL